MKKLLTLASLLVMASIVLAACGGAGPSTASDLLGAIEERGYILVSTDPNYEPQSFLNTDRTARVYRVVTLSEIVGLLGK